MTGLQGNGHPSRFVAAGAWRKATRGALTIGSLFVVKATCLGQASAHDVPFIVLRDGGAGSCPTAAQLERSVVELRQRVSAKSLRYRIRFSRVAAGYRAEIENPRDGSVRVLEDAEHHCRGLARATAVTLALLLDPELPAAPGATSAPITGSPAEVTPSVTHDSASVATAAIPSNAAPTTPAPSLNIALAQPAAPAELAPEVKKQAVQPPILREPEAAGQVSTVSSGTAAAWASAVHAGPGVLAGVFSPLGLGVFGSADVTTRSLRFDLGVFWAPSQTREFGSGKVNTSLLAGAFHFCVAPLRSTRFRIELCPGFFAGRLEASANGYARNAQSYRPWFAIPLALNVALETTPLGFQIGAAGLLPLYREDFQIDGLGVAYASTALAGLFYVRASARWWRVSD